MSTKLNCGYCYYCSEAIFSVGSHQSKCRYKNDTETNIRQRQYKLRQLEVERLNSSRASVIGHYVCISDLFPHIKWLEKFADHSSTQVLKMALRYNNLEAAIIRDNRIYWHKSIALNLAQHLSPQLYVDMLSQEVPKQYDPSIVNMKNTIKHLEDQVTFLTRANVESLNEIERLKQDSEYLSPLPIKPRVITQEESQKRSIATKKAIATKKENQRIKANMYDDAVKDYKNITDHVDQIFRDNQAMTKHLLKGHTTQEENDRYEMTKINKECAEEVLAELRNEWNMNYSDVYTITSSGKVVEVVKPPKPPTPKILPINLADIPNVNTISTQVKPKLYSLDVPNTTAIASQAKPYSKPSVEYGLVTEEEFKRQVRIGKESYEQHPKLLVENKKQTEDHNKLRKANSTVRTVPSLDSYFASGCDITMFHNIVQHTKK